MADEEFRVGADFSDVADALHTFEQDLAQTNNSVIKFSQTLRSVDENGGTTKTFVALTKSGEQFTITLKELAGGVEVTRFAVKSLTDEQIKYGLILEEARRASERLVESQARYIAANERVNQVLSETQPKILGANAAWLAQVGVITDAGKALAQYVRTQQVFTQAAQTGADAAFSAQKLRFNLLRQQAEAAPRGPGSQNEDEIVAIQSGPDAAFSTQKLRFNLLRQQAHDHLAQRNADLRAAHTEALEIEAAGNQAMELLEEKHRKAALIQEAAILEDKKRTYQRFISENQYGPYKADFLAANSGKPPKDEKGFASGFGDSFANQFSANALGFAAGGAILQGVNMLGSALKQGAQDAVEFDRRMARLSITEAGTTSATSLLAHEVLGLSNKFNLDKFDVAQARYKAVSQGATDAAHSMEFLNQTLGLAQVTGTSAEQATVAVASAIRAFGLHADDAQHVSELLFQTWKDGNVDINNLGDNLGRIGAVAAPLGFKLEDIIALFVTFRQRGIEGGEAISTLSNWVQRLAGAPTPELTMRIKELGYATAEEALRAGDMAKVLQMLGKQADITGENIVKMLGGIRTSRGGLAEVGFFQEAIDRSKALNKETHDLEAGVKETTEHTGEHLKKLGTELSNFFSRIGNEIIGGMDLSIKDVGRILDAFAKDHLDMDLGAAIDAQQKRDAGARAAALPEHLSAIATANIESPTGPSDSDIFKDRVKAQMSAAIAEEQIYNEKVAKEARAEELLTEKLKDQLAIRLARFEDSVRQHMEVAARAKEISRQAQENIVTINEDYATAKYGRQMSLLTPEQQALQLRATLPNSQIQLPWLEGGLGNTNLIDQRMKSLQKDREDHVDALSTKTGDAFLASKDLEKAQKDSQEIAKIQADQFTAVAEAYKDHKATLQDVEAMQRSITAEKDKQLELQKKIQEAMDKKAADEKAAADAEKERLAQVKDASEKALAMSYDTKKYPDAAAMMKQFDDLRKVAMKNITPSEYAGLAQLFETKKKSLEDNTKRVSESNDEASRMKAAQKEFSDTAGLKDLGKNLDSYADKQTKIFKDLEEHIKALSHPISAGGTGRIVDEHGRALTYSGLKELTPEQRAEKEEAAKAETEVKVKEAYAYASGKLAGPYIAGLSGAAPTAGNRAATETRDQMIARLLREQDASNISPQLGGTREDGTRWDSYVGESRDTHSPGGIRFGHVNALDRLIQTPAMGKAVSGPKFITDDLMGKQDKSVTGPGFGGMDWLGATNDDRPRRTPDPNWLEKQVKAQTDSYGIGGTYARNGSDGYDFAPQASAKYQAASQTNTGSVQGGTQFNMTVNASDGPPNVELNAIILGVKKAERHGLLNISDKEMSPSEYVSALVDKATRLGS